MDNQSVQANRIGVLSPQQEEQLQTLAATLTPEQALWISGYLAGLASPVLGEDLTTPTPEREARIEVTVLYGSETGNAAELARHVGSRIEERGLKATVVNMADYAVRQLKKVDYLVVISSTHGEGDPPEPAALFFEDLHSRKAPRLEGVRFAVLALGDSTYEYFCEAGKAFDRRFEELGGERFQERIDCDIDYEEDAESWMERILERLPEEAESTQAELGNSTSGAAGGVVKTFPRAFNTATTGPRYDKGHPFPAPVLDSVTLTGRGSSKQIQHVELSLEEAGLQYAPGDSLGVVPQNNPELVRKLIEKLALDGEEPILLNGEEIPLVEALTHHYEITVLTPRFLQRWGELSEASDLLQMSVEENKKERRAFLARNHVVDLVQSYPVSGITGKRLTEALRRLQPRLYSLASSPAAMPDEAHLTVSLLRYELNRRTRYGVASNHLCRRLTPGETLPVYVQENPNFRLPRNGDTPMIMVGAGTGVAPYRAFLQERQERGEEGRNWLIFGERNFRTDFLYQTEWQRLLEKGVLNRMSVAFSRDQEHKIYVQDRLQEMGRDLYAWLEEGAHFYVCGDAENMAPAVHETLQCVIAREGAMSSEKAADYLRQLRSENRYQRDVY